MERLAAAGTVGDIIADDLVLVFDTETSGLPAFSKPSDDPEQPYVLELAAQLCRSDGTVIETYSEIINVGVPTQHLEAFKTHGITDEMVAKGIPPEQAWADFERLVDRASLIVGHVISFDLRMMRIMAAKVTGKKWECPKPSFCTQFAAGKLMGVVKPKLTAAFKHFTGEDLQGAHRALNDVDATRRVYLCVAGTQEAKPPRDPATRPVFDDKPAEAAPEAKGSVVGDNGAPAFDEIAGEINDLYAEAKHWLDGSGVQSEADAEGIAKLRDKIRAAAKRAEEMRKTEAEPFDKGKAEVQERYNPLVQKDRGKCDLALKAANNALAPWLRKKDDEQRAIAAKAQQEANEKAAAAMEAAREAAKSDDLGKQESAEDLISQAQNALRDAKRADAAKPQVSGGARAVGLKSVWTPVMTDPTAAIEYFRAARPAALKEWMMEQAKIEVRSGKHAPDAIPGFRIDEEKVPV